MAWIGAAVGAGAGLIGDFMSQSGQKSTNAAMLAMQQQNEQWMEKMSDTAMQRRVTDLKNAGLNPMLAIGQGGASTPGISPVSLQNPEQSFSNMGSQVTNALQLGTMQSQIEATKAQADKANADAANTRAQLPFTAASSQATLDNLRRTNDVLYQQAENLYKDFQIKDQAQLPMLIKDADFRQRFLELQQSQMELDLQRGNLGLPRLENDAAWQKAHPELAGWLSSGTTSAATDILNTAMKTFKPPAIFNFGRQ